MVRSIKEIPTLEYIHHRISRVGRIPQGPSSPPPGSTQEIFGHSLIFGIAMLLNLLTRTVSGATHLGKIRAKDKAGAPLL